MPILEDLFSGNINPVDKYVKHGGEYHKANSKLMDKINSLQKSMNKEENELFDNIVEDFNKLGYITDRESFIDGFCLGLKMVAEVIFHKSESFI